MTAAALAEAFTNDIRSFRFHTMRVWGSLPMRPQDYTYELCAASAQGDRLELQVADPADPQGPTTTLSVWDPSDLSIRGEELVIQAASRQQARLGKQHVFAQGERSHHH